MYKTTRQPIFPVLAITLGSMFITACQTTPTIQTKTQTPQPHINADKPTTQVIQENGAKRSAVYDMSQPPIQSNTLPSSGIVAPKTIQPNVVLRDGSNIPAFRVLITRAQQQIQAGQFDAAEQTLIQAQRMAPQSTAVYAYLSQVSLSKRQGSNAEAMARKGLLLARTPRQQHAFWQLILAAAQLQNNPALASQAQQQLQQLSTQL